LALSRDSAGHFQTSLTEELLENLCTVHREGSDFRNMTALRCGVHPKMLTRWLKLGAASEDPSDLNARLFADFGRIEGDTRAECIKEIRNPETKREESHFDDEGKLLSKTSTSRSTTGIQWYVERRFRQWRTDWVQREDEGDVQELLVQQQGALSPDAAKYIIAQLADAMPPELRAIFEAKGWRQIPETARAKET
jgi:hypothetical protein